MREYYEDDMAPTERVADAIAVLEQYNRYVAVMDKRNKGALQQLSRAFLSMRSDINKLVNQAGEDVKVKIERMAQIARRMPQQFEPDIAFLESGSWTCLSPQRCILKIVLLTPVAVLQEDELTEILKASARIDPEQLVRAVQKSLSSAMELSQYCELAPGSQEPFVNHLLGVPNGYQLALELCLALKMNDTLNSRHSTLAIWTSCVHADLEVQVLELLGAYRPILGDPAEAPRLPSWHRTDLAVLRRRVWDRTEEEGCIEDSRRDTDCSYQRRKSLCLIHHLQIGAYSQIRAKIHLTLPMLLPEELYEMIFECAMAGEMIPLDPRVTKPDWYGSHLCRSPWQYHCYQQCFGVEYMCPKYEGLTVTMLP